MARNVVIKGFSKDIYEFWFPKKTNEIILITSEDPQHKKSEDALTTSENYSYLDNVGDKDTLLETAMFLSRHYPKARIKRLFPREFNHREDSDKNLVVIGGPVNNDVCKRIMAKIKSQISYSTTDWNIQVRGVPYDYIYSEKTGMEKDYGYFAAFDNPLKRTNRVILINGMNTFGVVGAFKAFSDLDESRINFQTIRSRIDSEDESINFECFFEVFVYNCELNDCTKVIIECPIIKKKNVFLMDENLTITIANKSSLTEVSGDEPEVKQIKERGMDMVKDEISRVLEVIESLNVSIHSLELRRIRITDAKSKLDPNTQTDALINQESRIADLERDIESRRSELYAKRGELLSLLFGERREFSYIISKVEEKLPELSSEQVDEFLSQIVELQNSLEQKGLPVPSAIAEVKALSENTEASVDEKRSKIKLTFGLLPKIEIEKEFVDPNVGDVWRKFWQKTKEIALLKVF